MLELIATDLAKSRSSLAAVTALIDSLFVRTSSPSRGEIRGSDPRCRQFASSLLVPSAPAAKTTPRTVRVERRLRSHGPERSLVTSYPSEPSPTPPEIGLA